MCGLGPDMEAIIGDVLARTDDVIESVREILPRGFPDELFAVVTTGLRKAARQLERMPRT